jgi:hypothetical protein
MQDYQLPKDKALILRSCKPDMTSYNGFLWPESGAVICPDWDPKPFCGSGLHGWLWGVGNFSLKYKEPNAKWLVVEVDPSVVVQLDGKVKYPSGTVIITGSFKTAWDLIMKWYWIRHAESLKEYSVTTSSSSNHAKGDNEIAITSANNTNASAAGYNGHASAAGYNGHASAAGEYGHASAAGKHGHASAAGEYGHASAAGEYRQG